jgi:hypothetical protein
MRTCLQTILCLVLITGCGSLDSDKGSDSADEGSGAAEDGSEIQSMALESKKDLPKCASANDSQLAYVKGEKKFYECSDSKWTSIDIVEQVEPLEDNEWRDPVTDLVWLIGGRLTYGFIATACSGDYRVGTQAEIEAAGLHGLESENGIWINGSTNKYLGSGRPTTDATNALHNAVCVKE